MYTCGPLQDPTTEVLSIYNMGQAVSGELFNYIYRVCTTAAYPELTALQAKFRSPESIYLRAHHTRADTDEKPRDDHDELVVAGQDLEGAVHSRGEGEEDESHEKRQPDRAPAIAPPADQR